MRNHKISPDSYKYSTYDCKNKNILDRLNDIKSRLNQSNSSFYKPNCIENTFPIS